MKYTLVLATLLFVLLPVFAVAADLTLAWDNSTNQAWQEVRAYEVIDGGYVLKGTVAGDILQITISNVSVGTHTYIVRSFMQGVESANSNTASTDVLPTEPSNLRIIVVEVNADGSMNFRLVDPAEFFRG